MKSVREIVPVDKLGARKLNLKQGSPQMITRKIGRRDFLKMTGTTLAGAALFGNAGSVATMESKAAGCDNRMN
jgi:TAT (twin-arginine translocation) pathway signal sequence